MVGYVESAWIRRPAAQAAVAILILRATVPVTAIGIIAVPLLVDNANDVQVVDTMSQVVVWDGHVAAHDAGQGITAAGLDSEDPRGLLLHVNVTAGTFVFEVREVSQAMAFI